jgi:hypothetical protein
MKRTETAPSSARTTESNKKSVKSDEQKTPKKPETVEKSNRIVDFL